VSAVIAAGIVVIAASIYRLVPQAFGTTWLIVAGLAVVTGSFMIKVPRTETRFSLSDALVFTSVLLLGPERAVVISAVDALAASFRFNKRGQLFASRMAFNVAAAAISVWVPGHLFLALRGGQPLDPGSVASLASIALPLLVFVVSYSLLNTGAVALVIALSARLPVAAVWRENFAWVWVAHAWSGLAAGAIAAYVPSLDLVSFLLIVLVGGVGYATVRVYLQQVEASTGHLQKLNELYLATIRALAMAIDAKDQVTHGHIRRVQVYAVGLAQALGIKDDLTLKGIEAGALLHDTGKIAVPEHILNKPGKLNAQEYERMKTHVTIGADILSGIDFPYPVIPFVRHHHENWDGTGYPDGLKGEDIPLGARILSVVDCFDALTSDRPYRRALTADAAVAILRDRAGTMYDASVVEKFIEIHPALTASLQAEEPPAIVSPAGEPAMKDADVPVNGFGEDNVEFDASLAEVTRLAASGLSAEEVAFVLTTRLKRQVRFATCAVYAPRPSDDCLVAVHAAGRHSDLYRHTVIPPAEGLSGWVAANGQFIVNANPALDLHGPVRTCEVQLASALVVPFTANNGARGALALYAQTPDAFTLEHARVAGVAATHLSRAFRVAASTASQAEGNPAAYCA
jgi:putative nucleotidyltransferase with HDIG domain